MKIIFDGVSYALYQQIRFLFWTWHRRISQRYPTVTNLKEDSWFSSHGIEDLEDIPIERKVTLEIVQMGDIFAVRQYRGLFGWETLTYQTGDENASWSEPISFGTQDEAYQWVIANL